MSTGVCNTILHDSLFAFYSSPPSSGESSQKRPMDKKLRRQIANSNERRRMQSINEGFHNLRLLMPHLQGEKMSKVDGCSLGQGVVNHHPKVLPTGHLPVWHLSLGHHFSVMPSLCHFPFHRLQSYSMQQSTFTG